MKRLEKMKMKKKNNAFEYRPRYPACDDFVLS